MPNERAIREARTFARYLGAPAFPEEIAQRYEMAIAQWRLAPPDRFDAWLTHFAAAGPALTSLADAYARLARPYGDVRRRLTLMLALLETHGATHAAYDRSRSSSALTAWSALVGVGAWWALRSVLAVLVCAPAHLLLGAKAASRQTP